MKTHRTVRMPCVIWPAQAGKPEQHIIHGTHMRAQRNAAMTAIFGSQYHVHETERLTIYGWLLRLLGRVEDEKQ